jgi:uncharacterized protein YndB with AHSA1/START domain
MTHVGTLLDADDQPSSSSTSGWYARTMADKEVVTVEALIDHPIEEVFLRYTDHAGWSRWAGFGPVRLVREGSPQRDGTGSVRAFSLAPGLREEVTRFEPPARMEYRVVQGGFPITDHLGEVLFATEGRGTRITWRVSFRSKVPGVGRILSRGLAVVFKRVLTGLAREMGPRAESSPPRSEGPRPA